MKHSHSSLKNTISQLVLVAAIGLGSVALADYGLPNPGFEITAGNTALLVTDPQNDFLSPDGAAWSVVGANVEANGTVEHIEQMFAAASETGMPVFGSPHRYYPHDHGWKFEGTLDLLMHNIGMFDRTSALNTDGFESSGADWLERHKPFDVCKIRRRLGPSNTGMPKIDLLTFATR